MDMDMSNAGRRLDFPEGGSVLLCGALDVQETEGRGGRGLRPLRLPQSSFVQFSSYERESMRTVISGCSGVHLRVLTDADAVALTVRCTRVDYGELPSAANGFAASVDGRIVCEAESHVDAVERVSRDGRSCSRDVMRGRSTVILDGLGVGEKTVTIWLPQTMLVDLIAIRGVNGERVNAAPASALPRWVHYEA